MPTIFDKFEVMTDGSGLITRLTKKVVINSLTYTATDMKSGTTPICDKTTLAGNSWTFTQDQLPATVIYALNTPTTEYVSKSLIPTIPIYKTNTLSFGAAVLPSSVTVTAPTTDDASQVFTLSPINGWTVITNSINESRLLKTGGGRLILNLTAPASFNQTICVLPSETRPKVVTTVLGFNGTTPTAIVLNPNGDVTCPTTITGNLVVDATYII